MRSPPEYDDVSPAGGRPPAFGRSRALQPASQLLGRQLRANATEFRAAPLDDADDSGDNDDGTESWWHSLDDSLLDPITLEPLNELPFEPFTLRERFHFDAEALAAYVVASGTFENPLSREAMTLQECVDLDAHLAQHRVRPLGVQRAFELNAAKEHAATTATDGGGAEVREARLRSAAQAVLRSLFDARGNAPAARPARREAGRREPAAPPRDGWAAATLAGPTADDDEAPATQAIARFSERDAAAAAAAARRNGGDGARADAVVDDFPSLPSGLRGRPLRAPERGPFFDRGRQGPAPRPAQPRPAQPRAAAEAYPALGPASESSNAARQSWVAKIEATRQDDAVKRVQKQLDYEAMVAADDAALLALLAQRVVSLRVPEDHLSRQSAVLGQLLSGDRSVANREADSADDARKIWNCDVLKWAKTERRRVVVVEEAFEQLLRVRGSASKSFRPQRRVGRKMTHFMAEAYGFETCSYDKSPERYVKVTKLAQNQVQRPDVLLSLAIDLCEKHKKFAEAPAAPKDKPKKAAKMPTTTVVAKEVREVPRPSGFSAFQFMDDDDEEDDLLATLSTPATDVGHSADDDDLLATPATEAATPVTDVADAAADDDGNDENKEDDGAPTPLDGAPTAVDDAGAGPDDGAAAGCAVAAPNAPSRPPLPTYDFFMQQTTSRTDGGAAPPAALTSAPEPSAESSGASDAPHRGGPADAVDDVDAAAAVAPRGDDSDEAPDQLPAAVDDAAGGASSSAPQDGAPWDDGSPRDGEPLVGGRALPDGLSEFAPPSVAEPASSGDAAPAAAPRGLASPPPATAETDAAETETEAMDADLAEAIARSLGEASPPVSVTDLLILLGMDHHCGAFQREEVWELDCLRHVDGEDLAHLGVSDADERRTILAAVATVTAHQPTTMDELIRCLFP
ncbi:hypothetical protein M885DRAFT_534394 [Pelagophyceae sp. CCMP2097]|nr:hypothetical protein M885DRAFT_534394 [Pelagophyceae sp. CCMP2097]